MPVTEKPAIFVFSTAYQPLIGGAEIAIEEIAKRLSEQFRFVIITARMRRGLARREERPEGAVVRIGFGSRLDKFLLPFWGTTSALALMRRERPVLFWPVMVGFASGIPYLVNIIRFWKRVPVILTLQEGDSEAHIGRARFGMIGLAWRLALARTDVATAISTYLERLSRRYGYTGPAEVIPNGVPLERFNTASRAERASLRRRMGVSPDEALIITISRLTEKNAVDVLIRGVLLLRAKGEQVKLAVVGDGEEHVRLDLLAHELNLGDTVIFLGSVPNSEIPRYLAAADVFCRPSRSEGLGISFLEAMAAGVPVVATSVGGIADFLRDGENGLVCRVDDPGDCAAKIALLLGDPKLRHRLAAGGRATAAGYDWGTIAARTSAVFRTAMTRPTVRLLVATGIFPPDIGGPAGHATLLAHAFPPLGYAPRILTYADRMAPPGVRWVSRRRPKGLRHLVYFLRCLGLGRGASVVYALDAAGAGLPVTIAAILLQKPLVVRIVGDYAWEQGVSRFGVEEGIDEFQSRRYGGAVGLLRIVQRFIARRATRVVVPSIYLKRIVAGWGVPEDKIEVIANAVPIPERLPAKSEARRSLGLSARALIVISAGRFVPWKGFDLLIGIMPELRREHPELRLIIVGDGPDRARLEALAAGTAAVTFTGALPESDLLCYLAAADVFALNTGYEGLSHLLIEAMACGTPVLTTRAGGNEEAVEDGVEGRLVGYNDREGFCRALASLLADAGLRRKLGAVGRRAAERFAPAVMLGRLDRLFRAL